MFAYCMFGDWFGFVVGLIAGGRLIACLLWLMWVLFYGSCVAFGVGIWFGLVLCVLSC